MSVNVLLSFAYYSAIDLAAVRRELVCGKLMIDSGAFTVSTQGKVIDLVEYAEYLERWRGCWDHAVTLDVIGDPEQTRRNTRKLRDRGLPVMPVFTRGESVREFDAMVRDAGYVCVGGGVGMSAQVVQRRIGALQHRAEQLGGGVHALGMGSVGHLRKAMPYSADSSNISSTFVYGHVRYFTGHSFGAVVVSDKKGLRRHWNQLREHDIDVGFLAANGRMPDKNGRPMLARSMGLAYTSADEWIRQVSRPVPVPTGIPDPRTGPHLYSAVMGGFVLAATTQLDAMLHDGYRPPVWEKYGRQHQCYQRAAVA